MTLKAPPMALLGYSTDPGPRVISQILRTKRVFMQLKEDVGTNPRFFYYFDV